MSLVTFPDSIGQRLGDAVGQLRGADEGCRWAASGGLSLTGDPLRPPLIPPAPVAGAMAAAGVLLDQLAPGVIVDAPALLGERAALLGLTRAGRRSCGGACRLLRARDGWLAVALARPDDWDSVDAWLGCEPSWEGVETAVGGRRVTDVAGAARLLGIPVTIVAPGPGAPAVSPWVITAGACRSEGTPRRPKVADLSALWAGPLCGDVWARSGARVTKVEDPARPDGARLGHAGFFRLLNGTKRPLLAALGSPTVRRLLEEADVIITSSRRRAFDQAGIDVERILAERPRVWVAITAHGWSGDEADRVGFGDDVAAGAGLVAWDPEDGCPRFVADAVADPLCGTLAAVASLAAHRAGGSWLIDASLDRAARYVAGLAPAGPASAVGPDVKVPPPRARRD